MSRRKAIVVMAALLLGGLAFIAWGLHCCPRNEWRDLLGSLMFGAGALLSIYVFPVEHGPC